MVLIAIYSRVSGLWGGYLKKESEAMLEKGFMLKVLVFPFINIFDQGQLFYFTFLGY